MSTFCMDEEWQVYRLYVFCWQFLRGMMTLWAVKLVGYSMMAGKECCKEIWRIVTERKRQFGFRPRLGSHWWMVCVMDYSNLVGRVFRLMLGCARRLCCFFTCCCGRCCWIVAEGRCVLWWNGVGWRIRLQWSVCGAFIISFWKWKVFVFQELEG